WRARAHAAACRRRGRGLLVTVSGFFRGIRELAHAVLPLAGVGTAASAVIAVFIGHFGVPQDTTIGVIGSIGFGAAAGSKWIDSQSFTRIQVAAQMVSSGNVIGAVQELESGTTPAMITPGPPPPPPTVYG